MTEREAHLVGSLPGPTPLAAMTSAVDILGARLSSLPDGETGERRNWVLSIVEGLHDNPDLELRRSGDWSDYDKIPQFKVRKGRTLYGANLDFGHVAAVTESFPDFQQVRAAAGLEDLVFQEGVPGDFDLAMFSLGPAGALRHRRAFTEATLSEIRQVSAITGPDTVFQVEVPAELVLLSKAPPPARAALAKVLARPTTGLAAGSPAGTRFAVHLCLGDMNNKPFGTLDDVSPLVLLSNAIVAGWPAGRPLDLIHAPFAAADQPAPTDPAYYAPLSGLVVPPGTRFAAGFAHESQTVADQLTIRGLIEDQLGSEVTISAACGLGRRSEEDGRAVMERMALLCEG